MISAFRFYVNKDGKYLGATDGEPLDGDGVVEVPYPPSHAKQVWDGSGWSVYVAPEEQKRLIMAKAMEVLDPVGRAALASTLAAGQLLLDAGDKAGLHELVVSQFNRNTDGAELEFLQYVQEVLGSGD